MGNQRLKKIIEEQRKEIAKREEQLVIWEQTADERYNRILDLEGRIERYRKWLFSDDCVCEKCVQEKFVEVFREGPKRR